MNSNRGILHHYFSVEANRNYLCRFIARRVSDPQLVDDLAQETILAVYKYFENDQTLIRPEQLTGFVCQTSRFIVKRNWKYQNRHWTELDSHNISAEDTYTGLMEFDAIQQIATYCSGWAKTSEVHRRWSLLHWLDGLPCEEIARMENPPVSADAVRKAIYRLKKGRKHSNA